MDKGPSNEQAKKRTLKERNVYNMKAGAVVEQMAPYGWESWTQGKTKDGGSGTVTLAES